MWLHLLNWFLRPTLSEYKKLSGLGGLTTFRVIMIIGLIIAIPSMIITFAPSFGISEEMMRENENTSWLYSNRASIITSLIGLAFLGFALYIRYKQLKGQYQKDKLPKIGELPKELQIAIMQDMQDRRIVEYAETQNDVFTNTGTPPPRDYTEIPDRDNW